MIALKLLTNASGTLEISWLERLSTIKFNSRFSRNHLPSSRRATTFNSEERSFDRRTDFGTRDGENMLSVQLIVAWFHCRRRCRNSVIYMFILKLAFSVFPVISIPENEAQRDPLQVFLHESNGHDKPFQERFDRVAIIACCQP